MLQNIFLITLLILLFFFISNEKNINEIMSKKYIKYLLILVIVYFIYQNYNLVLLIIAILITIYFNIDFKEKFNTNKYISMVKEKFSNFKFEDEIDDESKIEKEKIEPFKENVSKIKDLFENIKMEIKRII